MLPANSAIVATDLTTGVQNRRVIVQVDGQIDIAANAGNVAINRGSLLAGLQFFVSEGGADTWKQVDPRIARWLTGVLGGAILPATRITTAQAVAGQVNFALSEQFVLNFGNPRGVSERETFYLEANSAQRFQVRAQLLPNAAQRIITPAGGAALTLHDVAFTVFQDYALNEPGLPVFKPLWTVQTIQVPAASANIRELILTSERLRGIVIQQDCAAGEVSDIVNSFAIRGDNGDIIGPDFVNAQQRRAWLNTQYGGIEPNTNGYDFIDFSPDGRISSYAYPDAQFTNLRILLNAQPSAAGGGAGSVVNLVLLEMARPKPVAGKLVVTEAVPEFAEVQ